MFWEWNNFTCYGELNFWSHANLPLPENVQRSRKKITWTRSACGFFLAWVGAYEYHCFGINAHFFIFQIGHPTLTACESVRVRVGAGTRECTTFSSLVSQNVVNIFVFVGSVASNLLRWCNHFDGSKLALSKYLCSNLPSINRPYPGSLASTQSLENLSSCSRSSSIGLGSGSAGPVWPTTFSAIWCNSFHWKLCAQFLPDHFKSLSYAPE